MKRTIACPNTCCPACFKKGIKNHLYNGEAFIQEKVTKANGWQIVNPQKAKRISVLKCRLCGYSRTY